MNALEAMQTTPMAERRIVVSTECSGDSVITGVRDFGRGLPRDDPDKIFTHFYSTKPGGMGMGLTDRSLDRGSAWRKFERGERRARRPIFLCSARDAEM